MISSVAKLHDILEACGRVAIAFSGGCDSAVLAEAARRTLGADNVLLLIAVSVLLPRSELRRAESCAAGLRLEKIEFDPLSHPEVAANTPQRCYFCKKNLFNTLLVCSTAAGFPTLADGTNADDPGDYRPGLRAADELGILHPFLEAGITKREVRALGREWGVPVWNLPAAACLASRIPTGTPLTATALHQVEQAENQIRELGFSGFRVRHLGDAARLELRPEELEEAVKLHSLLEERLHQAGFSSFETAPYRTGSMNGSR